MVYRIGDGGCPSAPVVSKECISTLMLVHCLFACHHQCMTNFCSNSTAQLQLLCSWALSYTMLAWSGQCLRLHPAACIQEQQAGFNHVD
jgi:hypothetical protein